MYGLLLLRILDVFDNMTITGVKYDFLRYFQVFKVLIKMLSGDVSSPGKRKSIFSLLLHGELGVLFRKLVNRWKQAWKLSFFYVEWMKKNEYYVPELVSQEIESFVFKPLISIVMPVYNVKVKFLREAVESLRNNYYPNWELCICDDASDIGAIKDYLNAVKLEEPRIKVSFRELNGHISVASNDALSMASGEFVGLLDHDDVLAPFSLFEVVKELNKNRELDFIYSNEDLMSSDGIRTWPVFKPDFAPHTFLSSNYLCHFSVIRKSLIDAVGGFRAGFEGSQDYDLFLRCIEKTDKIFHIRKVLYHWRVISGSTAQGHDSKPYAYMNGLKALQEHIVRSGKDAVAYEIDEVPHYRCVFNVNDDDFVSIIIPGRNQSNVLKTCLESIYQYEYKVRFEVIYVDNDSDDPAIKTIIADYESNYDNFKVLSLAIDFNYSILNNRAAEIASGNLFMFLNNDCQVISSEWLDFMAGYAKQPEAGVVGAKLLYPNGRIQHAGIYFAPGNTGRHLLSGCSGSHQGIAGNMYYQYNVSAVTGACMMVDRGKFVEAGGFDEQLGVCLNDIDLCLSLRKAGYHNVVLPFVELYHYEALSRGYDINKNKELRFGAEKSYFQQRWGETISENYYPMG